MQRQNFPVQTLFSAYQAAENAPSLARLAKLARESRELLRIIEPLIPEALRSAVEAGPIDNDQWCLLVQGNASAAKIRQLMPLLQNRLRQNGYSVASIRLKIRVSRTPR